MSATIRSYRFLPARKSVGDADAAARSIFIRNLLGVPTRPERLISTFEGPDHFLTYMFERYPSVTTNCNSLTAILEAPDMTLYGPQIEKLVRYITAAWCDPDLVFADKLVSTSIHQYRIDSLTHRRTCRNSTPSC